MTTVGRICVASNAIHFDVALSLRELVQSVACTFVGLLRLATLPEHASAVGRPSHCATSRSTRCTLVCMRPRHHMHTTDAFAALLVAACRCARECSSE